MTIDDVALRVAQALNQAGVRFMIVGSFSSNYHGIPRSTKDADFVVELTVPLSADFAKLLGPEFEPEPQLSFETNTGTQRQEFRVKGTVFKIEVFRPSDDPHDQERFRRAITIEIKGCKIVFPTAEDVSGSCVGRDQRTERTSVASSASNKTDSTGITSNAGVTVMAPARALMTSGRPYPGFDHRLRSRTGRLTARGAELMFLGTLIRATNVAGRNQTN